MSFTEYQLDNLLELYLGEEAGSAVVTSLNRFSDKANLLVKSIERNEANCELEKVLIDCLSAYKIHQKNRNKIIHSYSISLEGSNLSFERPNGNEEVKVSMTQITVEKLNNMVFEIDSLNGAVSFAFMIKAQELGYRVLSGSVKIGGPKSPPMPEHFPDIHKFKVLSLLTKMIKR